MATAIDAITIPTNAGTNGIWSNAIVWISSSL
jgi:hypothetical protein